MTFARKELIGTISVYIVDNFDVTTAVNVCTLGTLVALFSLLEFCGWLYGDLVTLHKSYEETIPGYEK